MFATNGSRRPSEESVARATMVREQLQRRGITDLRVIQAMGEVPRHLFVPPEWRHDAYTDRPLPIAEGQTISQPYMVALMLQSLSLPPNARVLEVGTGSGYQAAVLSRLAAHVYTIEYFARLAELARAVLAQLHYGNVQVIVGDGSYGLPTEAPYDGIIVAAAAPQVPPSLLAQLRDGARLVIPVGEPAAQDLLIVVRQGSMYNTERSVACRFVPLLGQGGWSAGGSPPS
jgi:protein-L-isoaspartate(D-aspartate) O-methyltransferase